MASSSPRTSIATSPSRSSAPIPRSNLPSSPTCRPHRRPGQEMIRILYLHGFASSPASSKARFFAQSPARRRRSRRHSRSRRRRFRTSHAHRSTAGHRTRRGRRTGLPDRQQHGRLSRRPLRAAPSRSRARRPACPRLLLCPPLGGTHGRRGRRRVARNRRHRGLPLRREPHVQTLPTPSSKTRTNTPTTRISVSPPSSSTAATTTSCRRNSPSSSPRTIPPPTRNPRFRPRTHRPRLHGARVAAFLLNLPQCTRRCVYLITI